MTPATPARPATANAAGVTDIDSVAAVTDTRSTIRLGFWILVVGFGLFLAWAAWAPLDEGVIAPSTVSIETRRKVIQHLQGGVIQRVAVKEGSEVKQGDTLVVLDATMPNANLQVLRQSYISQRALESRLIAEATGAGAITFHADLLAANDAEAARHVQLQRQLFEVRRSAQAAEIGAVEQSIAGVQGQIAGLNQMLVSRQHQLQLQATQLANVQQLANDGFAPRNQVLQLQQSQADLKAGVADLEASIQRSISSIAELKLRIAQRRQEYLREASTQLSDVRREVQSNLERMSAVGVELQRTTVVAPVDGQVVGLSISSAGGVVTPGQRLLDIVPKEESLLLDAHVPPHVIDRVKVSDPTEVRFSSFANSPQLVVHGKVVSLSRDAISEQGAGGMVQTYYLARVEITAEGRKALGDRNLKPGMPAEVLIKTGERSLLTYLLHPLTKRVAAAMTEE